MKLGRESSCTLLQDAIERFLQEEADEQEDEQQEEEAVKPGSKRKQAAVDDEPLFTLELSSKRSARVRGSGRGS